MGIKAARAKATKEVADAKKYFKGALVELTAKIKQQENRLVGQRQAVTAMVEADRATQAKINRDTEASLKRIVKIADKRHTESKRARGFLRALFNQNKKIAANEIADMRKKASAQLAVGRAEAAAHKLKFAKDLTAATKKLNVALSKESADQAAKLVWPQEEPRVHQGCHCCIPRQGQEGVQLSYHHPDQHCCGQCWQVREAPLPCHWCSHELEEGICCRPQGPPQPA